MSQQIWRELSHCLNKMLICKWMIVCFHISLCTPFILVSYLFCYTVTCKSCSMFIQIDPFGFNTLPPVFDINTPNTFSFFESVFLIITKESISFTISVWFSKVKYHTTCHCTCTWIKRFWWKREYGIKCMFF